MLDYALTLGMTPEQYWNDDPRLILNYEKKYQNEQNVMRQKAWLVGAYVKSALQSTILVATLAEKKTARSMPEYAECPKPVDKDGNENLTPNQIKAGQNNLYNYLQNLARVINKQGGR